MKEYWIIGSVTHHDEDPELRFDKQAIIDGVERFNSLAAANAAIVAAGLVGKFVPVYIPTPGHYTIALR